jgi:hypothetical protein
MRRVAVGLALLCTVAPSGRGQEPQRPQPTFRGGVDVVQLQVSVLDRDRRPVRGLKTEDFLVFEDGKPEPIVAADEYTLDAAPEPEPVWAAAARSDVATNDYAERRLIAIVMDDRGCCWLPNAAGTTTPGLRGQPQSISDRWAIANAITTAHALIDLLGGQDLALVITTHENIAIDHFTADHVALHAAVKRFLPVSESPCEPGLPPRATVDLQRLMALAPQGRKAIFRIVSRGGGLGPRLPPCTGPASYLIPDTGQRVPVIRPPEGRRTDDATMPSVPTYELNVSGLKAFQSLRGNGPNATGGRNVYNTNDLSKVLPDLLRENETYYVVGFRTSRPSTDGHYRRLNMKIKGHDEYTVRMRPGYFRPRSLDPRKDDPTVEPLPQSVAMVLPSFDVTVTAAVAAFAHPSADGARLALTVDVEHPTLSADTATAEDLEVRTIAYADGDPKYDIRATLHLPLSTGATAKGTLATHIDVGPGPYELRLVVRDPRTNRLGTLVYELEVPDFAARTVSLSDVVLGRRSADGAAGGLASIDAATSREFGAADSVAGFLEVYQARGGARVPVSLTMKILDAAGREVVATTEMLSADRFDARGRLAYPFVVPIAKLTTGVHLLTFEARAGERAAPPRSIPFRVR